MAYLGQTFVMSGRLSPFSKNVPWKEPILTTFQYTYISFLKISTPLSGVLFNRPLFHEAQWQPR